MRMRHTLTLSGMLIGLAGLLHFLGLTNSHDWGGDFAQYLMQAKSLVEQNTINFIASNSFTINASSTPPGPVAYPWGFPLLLAPIYAWTGVNLIAFKLVVLGFYIGFLLVLYVGLRQRLSPYALLTVLSLFAFSPSLMRFNDEILSDIPFLFFSTAALLMINNRPFTSVLRGFGLGVIIFSAFLIRTNGILLIPTLLITFLGMAIIEAMAGNWKWTILRSVQSYYFCHERVYFLASVISVFMALYGMAIVSLPEGQSSHLNHLRQISAQQLFSHFFYYLILPAEFFSPNTSRLAGLPIYLLTLPFFCLGVRKYWKENIGFCVYFVLTFMMYVVWPHTQGLRFFLPIIPIYVFFFVLGTEVIQTKVLGLSPKALPKAIIVMFVIVCSYLAAKHVMHENSKQDGPYSADSIEMFDFIRANSAASDVVIFRKPRVMTFMTGIRSVRITQEEDIEKLNAVRLIVLDNKNLSGQLSDKYIQQKIQNHSLALAFANDQFKAYLILQR
jgi:hypothetical protein